MLLSVYSSGCAFFKTKALPHGYTAEAAPQCSTNLGPARVDTVVAGVFAGLALLVGAQAVGIIPGDRKTASGGLPGLLLLTAPFGASAGVGYHRVAECQRAQGAWATVTAQRERERQERLAAQARAEEERRAAEQREEERLAAQRRAEEERLAAEARAEEDRAVAASTDAAQPDAQPATEERAVGTAPPSVAARGPVAADGTPMLLPDGSYNPAFTNPPNGYRSPEGYQHVRWGMSEDEVKRAYPQLLPIEQGLYFEGETAGHKSVTAFAFSEHRLAFAAIVFQTTRQTVAQYIDDYNELKTLLTQKYGAPRHDNVNWREGKGFLGDSPDGLTTALRLGYATLETQWTTGETLIRLECESKKLTPEISIKYASLRLMPRMIQKNDQAKVDDL
ncbi:hypothetical protein [Archangium lansingense]|uniref:Uncharacterized protein n=1 Tax=Archangium lansingense TaxID=2995310 RepID=A0ABT4AFG3_9BACT|nr:hypothetical protein [Archangium lansinium]MCY1080306.1 hypothetical protein [Archangium lansinium]